MGFEFGQGNPNLPIDSNCQCEGCKLHKVIGGKNEILSVSNKSNGKGTPKKRSIWPYVHTTTNKKIRRSD